MTTAVLPSESPATPVASAGAWEPLFSNAGAEKALAASGDWTRGDGVIDVARARWLSLAFFYDGAAAGNYLHCVVMVSNAQDKPAVDDDSWVVPTVNDGTITDVVIDSGLPAGTDYTAETFGEVTQKQLLIKVPAALAGASSEARAEVPIDVSRYRWVQIMCAEKGVTATPGTLLVKYSLSA